MAGSYKFFGLDLSSVNWYLVMYVLFSIGAVAFTTMKLATLGSIRTVLYAIGSILVFVYFGFRWFGVTDTSNATWPPSINMCPDYLTYTANVTGGSSNCASGDTKCGCVDTLGVSTKSGGITKINVPTSTSLLNPEATKLFPYTSKDVIDATNATKQLICDACQAAGITWEGVYDGSACVAINPTSNNPASKPSCS